MKWCFFAVLCCHVYGQREIYLQRTDVILNSKLHLKERILDIERVVAALITNFSYLRAKSMNTLLSGWAVWRISDKTVTQASQKEKSRQVFIFSHFNNEADVYRYDNKEIISTFKWTMSTSDIRYRPVSRDLYWMGEETSYSVWNLGKHGNRSNHNMMVQGSVRHIRFDDTITIVMTNQEIFKMAGTSRPVILTKLRKNSGKHLFLETSSKPKLIWWTERYHMHVCDIWHMDMHGEDKSKMTIKETDHLFHSFTVGTQNNLRYIFLCADRQLKKLRLNTDTAFEDVLQTECDDVTVEGDKLYVYIRSTRTLETYDLTSGTLVHSLVNTRATTVGIVSFQLVMQ